MWCRSAISAALCTSIADPSRLFVVEQQIDQTAYSCRAGLAANQGGVRRSGGESVRAARAATAAGWVRRAGAPPS